MPYDTMSLPLMFLYFLLLYVKSVWTNIIYLYMASAMEVYATLRDLWHNVNLIA